MTSVRHRQKAGTHPQVRVEELLHPRSGRAAFHLSAELQQSPELLYGLLCLQQRP